MKLVNKKYALELGKLRSNGSVSDMNLGESDDEDDGEQKDKSKRKGTDENIEGKSGKICRFFISKSGCKKGDKCTMKHEINLIQRNNADQPIVASVKEGDDAMTKESEDTTTKPEEMGIKSTGTRDKESGEDCEKDGPEDNAEGRKEKKRNNDFTKECRYHQTSRGCLKGDDCTFIHTVIHSRLEKEPEEKGNERGSSASESVPLSKKIQIQCRFYMTKKGCLKGDECSFLHTDDNVRSSENEENTERKREKKRKECHFYKTSCIFSSIIIANFGLW